MFDRMIGHYLLEKGRINEQQLRQAYEQQGHNRARLGVIAVSEKLMTIPQAEEVNSLQATRDEKFGTLAIEKGYLTSDQVDRLLERQSNEYMEFCQALIDLGYLTLEDIENETAAFQNAHGLMESEIEALKLNDIGRIVSLLAREADEDSRKLIAIAIKNIYRLVDPHVTIHHAVKKTAVSGECIAYQKTSGRLKMCTSITGSYSNLQKIAMGYTKEEFIETKEDTLDALCELINCINGIFATAESQDNDIIDLEPPIYITTYANESAPVIYSLQFDCCGAVAYINVSASDTTQIR